MALLDKLANDYEVITRTELWGIFLAKLKDKRDVESRACEINEIVLKHQGAVKVLDDIIGRGKDWLPLLERILVDLQKENIFKEKMIE